MVQENNSIIRAYDKASRRKIVRTQVENNGELLKSSYQTQMNTSDILEEYYIKNKKHIGDLQKSYIIKCCDTQKMVCNT